MYVELQIALNTLVDAAARATFTSDESMWIFDAVGVIRKVVDSHYRAQKED